MFRIVIALCVTGSVLARSTVSNTNKIPVTEKDEVHSDNDTTPTSFFSDIQMLYNTYNKCSGDNVSVCLKLKLISVLNNAANSAKDLTIVDGVQFVQGDSFPVADTSNTEDEIVANLPRSLEAKETVLSSLIWDKIVSFFQSHTLQIKFPSGEDMERSMGDEARRRKHKHKKGGAMIMIPLLLGGTFIPIAFGALALLSGKALIISKLALVLASIIGIKKLLSGSTGHDSSHEVVVSGNHGGSGWGRDMDLAYHAYAPKDKAPMQ